MILSILLLSAVSFAKENMFPLKIVHAPRYEENLKIKPILKEIPPEVIKPCLDSTGKIADINEDWQFSDHQMLGDLRPRTHLKEACKAGDNKWEIVCETGGYSITATKYIFESKGGIWVKTDEEQSLELKVDCGK
jgi:hypothetical protein